MFLHHELNPLHLPEWQFHIGSYWRQSGRRIHPLAEVASVNGEWSSVARLQKTCVNNRWSGCGHPFIHFSTGVAAVCPLHGITMCCFLAVRFSAAFRLSDWKMWFMWHYTLCSVYCSGPKHIPAILWEDVEPIYEWQHQESWERIQLHRQTTGWYGIYMHNSGQSPVPILQLFLFTPQRLQICRWSDALGFPLKQVWSRRCSLVLGCLHLLLGSPSMFLRVR